MTLWKKQNILTALGKEMLLRPKKNLNALRFLPCCFFFFSPLAAFPLFMIVITNSTNFPISSSFPLPLHPEPALQKFQLDNYKTNVNSEFLIFEPETIQTLG